MTLDRRIRVLLVILVLAYAGIQMQLAHAITWDEVEFFRATRWIAEGRVPFLDFWEHHLPLQWFVFAPFAALLGDGPGAASVIVMRWVQLPLWIGIFAILRVLARRSGANPAGALLAPAALLASPLFLGPAVEYRIDTLGNAAYLAALLLALTRPRSPRAWAAFGALMSCAVLANMRLWMLVCATAAVLLFYRGDEQRWRFNGIALWMAAGVAAVASVFVIWLAAVGAGDAFMETMRLNLTVDRILREEAATLARTLLLPLKELDAAAILITIGAVAAIVPALRSIRTPGDAQLLAILALLSVLAFLTLGVHYFYHLETTLLLFVPLAAIAVRTPFIRNVAVAVVGIIVLVDIGLLVRPSTGAVMRYTDTLMRTADARTLPHERVWDGVGFALRREPSYRYWFLPSIVRIAAARGMIETYDAPQMRTSPPAAIIHGYRVHLWLRTFPAAAAYVTHHYVPLYRDLWIPGMSGTIGPRHPRVRWIAPRAGRYTLYASEVLVRHPWFRNPLQYGIYGGDDAEIFRVELARLPRTSRLQLIVDGAIVTSPTIELRKGAHVEVRSAAAADAGVLLVPADVETLFIEPEDPQSIL